MALKNQLSFASGEIDPILHDRVTLDRFQNGLATARNVMIGKTGSILSRFSREQIREVHHDGPIKLFSPPGTEDFVEFGVNDADSKFYVRYYLADGTLDYTFIETLAGDAGITADNLSDLQTVVADNIIYILMGSGSNSKMHSFVYLGIKFFTINALFTINGGPTGIAIVNTATGYNVDYAVTMVYLDQETSAITLTSAGLKKPILVGEDSKLTITLGLIAVGIENFNEVRIYRRPKAGSAYGLIGTTKEINIVGPNIEATFTDVGQNADFNNGIPSLVTKEGISGTANITDLTIGTGTIYQGRLALGNFVGENNQAIAASRPGFAGNFYRDFPYDGDSALLLKTSSEGRAVILRMIEADGLVVFTSVGVFISLGVLNISNLTLIKRGSWIIDESIPPLVIPGALLFVDKTTNSVRQLVYSQELGGYDSIDQSVFSNHLFRSKTISSWAYQSGISSILIVTFSDGTFATFTYSFEHKMRAWTRHDSTLPVEQVASTSVADTSYFVINNGGTRNIEKTIPRYITPLVSENNPEADKYKYGSFMDSMVTRFDLLNDSLVGTDTLTLTPVLAGIWDGQLTLNSGTSNIFATYGSAGQIFRVFDTVDKTELDLEWISTTDNNNIVVQVSETFPSTQSSSVRVYLTQTVISSLGHLEGELVAVMGDGKVLASPNNDSVAESFLILQVTAGVITLPSEFRSAIVNVGRHITADIQTLNVSTVEQSPTMVESLNVNKMYLRVFESRGLYVDNIFPEEKVNLKDGSTIEDMQDIDRHLVQGGVSIIANRYKQPVSGRAEVTVPGSWDTQGKISLRQVDPLHFELLSIIPDIEVHRRSDR